jgi:cytochrome P450
MRVRGLLSNSFTEDALRTQYPIIRQHADALVSQLRKLAQNPPSHGAASVVNMTDWVNFFTMDVIGDLAFGEPFGCLEKGEYHDWVRTLFMYLKFMTLAAAPRYYPWLEWFLMKLMPKSVMEGQRTHQKYADGRINKRLNVSTERADFMSVFMKKNHNFSIMSRKEMLSTFNFVIVGGSETSATVLTGLFSHMGSNSRVREKLCNEIRERFEKEEDIDYDSIIGLPYLEAVLNEGLRMCNPIPCGLPRTTPKGGDTYCGEYLPEGVSYFTHCEPEKFVSRYTFKTNNISQTRIGTRTFAINRSTAYFHDPDAFVPERWLPLAERPLEYHNDQLSASRPFSVGFHSCLGKPLAWVELRLVMCRLLWAFDFDNEGLDPVKFDDFQILMMVQKGALNLNIRERDQSKVE